MFYIDKIVELPQNSSVYFIGRYKFDVDLLKSDERLNVLYDNVKGTIRVRLAGRPDLNMEYYTVHRSKGLQADYVFIINNKEKGMGFPSKIENASLIEMLLEQVDQYPYAEERRLFYVALTRARKRVYLITVDGNLSVFAQELKRKYGEEMKKCDYICPLCGGTLLRKNGKNGSFFGCSNFSKIQCKYTKSIAVRKQ